MTQLNQNTPATSRFVSTVAVGTWELTQDRLMRQCLRWSIRASRVPMIGNALGRLLGIAYRVGKSRQRVRVYAARQPQ